MPVSEPETPDPGGPAGAWLSALEARHLADLRPAEVGRALRRRGSGGALTPDQRSDVASRSATRDLRPCLEAGLRGETVPPMPGRPDWTTVVPAASPSVDPSIDPSADPVPTPAA